MLYVLFSICYCIVLYYITLHYAMLYYIIASGAKPAGPMVALIIIQSYGTTCMLYTIPYIQYHTIPYMCIHIVYYTIWHIWHIIYRLSYGTMYILHTIPYIHLDV